MKNFCTNGYDLRNWAITNHFVD